MSNANESTKFDKYFVLTHKNSLLSSDHLDLRKQIFCGFFFFSQFFQYQKLSEIGEHLTMTTMNITMYCSCETLDSFGNS